MAKALWQITDYLKEKGFESEYDRDSRTLFVQHSTPAGDLQSRYYYDDEMEVLSCQCIYLENLAKARYAPLCELVNRCNEQLGFGAFMILDEEDLVFEINNLIDDKTPLSESVLEKLVMIPSEAMAEHLPLFQIVANENVTPLAALDELWEKE